MKYGPLSVCLFLSVVSTGLLAAEKPPTTPTGIVKEVRTPIDLNTADVAALLHRVKGIGPKRAEAIIKYRDAHHGFHQVEELGAVPGIGMAFVNRHLKALQAAFVVKQ